jgi:cell division protein FtsW (lipid II flippase)
MLARFFGRARPRPLAWREIGVGLGILALPVGLILLEPDAGQAMTYFPLLAVVIFFPQSECGLSSPRSY